MAILASMEWPGVTAAQYEAAMRELNMDADPPVGGVVHLAASSTVACELWTCGSRKPRCRRSPGGG